MAREYDLTVIGAGFAGLSAAHAAAQRGLKTMVLDCKIEAGAQPHTTGLLVKEVADLWDVPRALTRKIHGVRLYSPRMECVDLVRPGFHFLATDTPGLLRWWAQQARTAGAWVRFSAPYRGASRGGDRIQLNEYDIRTRYLLGADGARSRVAADFGLDVNRKFLTGVEVEYSGVKGVEEDRLHVFLDSKLAPGYIGWVVPGVGQTQVGLAVNHSHAGDMDAFLAKLRKLFDFSGAKVISRRGGLIPVGGPVRRFGDENVMLVGDAAGIVSPLTAGGIHTALQYGRLAGLAVTDHLLDHGREPHVVLREAVPSFAARRLLRTLYNAAPPNFLYNTMLHNRLFRTTAQVLFFHDRGLLNWQTWRDVTRHMIQHTTPAESTLAA